ncbi:hypothetical protein [Kitasatospora sp. NPDC058478]|uniref:hypothetical protein n=1 Tax=unclassified Kitasatospora TaxID=2633591 RepID=UPI00365ECA84
MNIHRDEISASAKLPADQAADLLAQLTQRENPTPGQWLEGTLLSSSAPAATPERFEVPADLDRWPAHEITGWLARLEDDDRVSDADLQRARQAVSTALGIED